MGEHKPLRRLGTGAFGTVFLCAQGDTPKLIADKQIDLANLESEDDSFRREADVMFKLMKQRHPNIVAFLLSFEKDNIFHVHMEFCAAGSLEKEMKGLKTSNSVYIEAEVLCYLHQMAFGLAYIHENNVFHRDLKPDNILFSSDGRLKIGDFGVSAALRLSEKMRKTKIGTIWYMAPEVIREDEYSESCDLWSLGVIVYELCTLKKPFTARTEAAAMHKILTSEPNPISETISDRLHHLVLSLLTKTPCDRPSCKQILEERFVQAEAFSPQQQRRLLQLLREDELSVHEACRQQRLSTVRRLLAAGNDPNMTEASSRKTALMVAEETGNVNLTLLLQDHKVNPGEVVVQVSRDDRQSSWTSLHVAAENGNMAEVQSLLQHGADINAKTATGSEAIHIAAEKGNVEMVRMLVELGANVNALSGGMLTPLHIAVKIDDVALVLALVPLGADINASHGKNFPPLHIAGSKGLASMIEQLVLLGADKNALHQQLTPLYVAAQNGHGEAVRSLLKFGADVDAGNENRATPLHIAAQNGHVDVVRTLLEHGANVNAVKAKERTPLHIAANMGHMEVIRALVESGADVGAKTERGSTAFDIAARSGHTAIAAALGELASGLPAATDGKANAADKCNIS